MVALWVILTDILISYLVVAAPPLSTNNESLSTHQKLFTSSEPYHRLPSNIVPVSYKLQIVTHLEDIINFPFEGKVEIGINIMEKTKTIILHARELNITALPTIMSAAGIGIKQETAAKYTIDNTTDFLRIKFANFVTPGDYKLFISYQGIVNDGLRGFYRASYENHKNKSVYLASTHFEATAARRAFPCFDEPRLKATFDISIKHQANFHAVSNMHVIKTEVDPKNHKQIWTTFAQTPKMSTYTVAFVVSDFTVLENDDLDFRVWARRSEIEKAEFALEVGPKILKELENYTGISQKDNGFEKMDCFAVPRMKGSAMENWGLNIFYEGSILFDENITIPHDQRQGVAAVIAHEFAHQWFGNLVTLSWWQHVWLNEGFATYFGFFIPDKVFPEWRFMDMFVVAVLQIESFLNDGEETAVAMNHVPDKPGGIDAKFNSISYKKASAVIRMISHILTDSKFKEALMTYLQSKKFDVASSSDLFSEFKEKFPDNSVITKEEFNDALVNWESNPGFPIITVTRDYTKNTSTIEQERFLFQNNPSHRERYWVALNYAQTKDCFHKTETDYWMKPTDTSITVPIPDSTTWAIFNKQQFGYYRVNYDVKNWKMIIDTLKSDKYQDIHVLNRAQLLNDALNLAEISKLDYAIVLDMVSYLKKEIDCIPWRACLFEFYRLEENLLRTQYYDEVKGYINHLFEHLERNLEKNPDPDDKYLMKDLKHVARSWTSRMEMRSCSRQRTEAFEQLLNNLAEKTSLNETHYRILCCGIRNADLKTWNRVFEKYKQLNDSDIFGALGCSTNEDILKKILHMAMNNKNSTDNDLLTVILGSVYKESEVGTNVVLDFIIENYTNVSGTLTDGAEKIFQNFLNNSEIHRFLGTREQLSKLKILKENIEGQSKDILDKINGKIKFAEDRLEWAEQRGPQIRRYLKESFGNDNVQIDNTFI